MQTFQHWRGLRQGGPQPTSTWSVSVSPSLCPVSSALSLVSIGASIQERNLSGPVQWPKSFPWVRFRFGERMDHLINWIQDWRRSGVPCFRRMEDTNRHSNAWAPHCERCDLSHLQVHLYDGESGRKRHTGVRHEWPLVPLGPTGFVIICFV